MWQRNVVFCSVVTVFLVSLLANVASANPLCERSDSDFDGDGFGWENDATCVVADSPVTFTSQTLGSELPVCQSASTDSNGDGFGWESNKSCRVSVTVSRAVPRATTNTITTSPANRPVCSSASSDADGDGFGWENNASCNVVSSQGNPGTASIPSSATSSGVLPAEEKISLRPACSDQRYASDGDGFGWENSRSCTFNNAGDSGASITDVILVTGQSNALGAETISFDPYEPSLDSPVRRLYAYSQNGWGIASLQQIWDRGWYPRGDIANEPANNFAFHFGKTLVRSDPDAVVGIVMVTAPGAGIRHWDRDEDFFDQIDSRVQAALSALPGDAKVRGILWHQGETDFYNTTYYHDRLRTLIGNFRAQSWLEDGAPFICGETFNAPVNAQLNALNSDGDANTACVTATDLSTIGDDLHFDAASLRILGARYAEEYQSLSRE